MRGRGVFLKKPFLKTAFFIFFTVMLLLVLSGSVLFIKLFLTDSALMLNLWTIFLLLLVALFIVPVFVGLYKIFSGSIWQRLLFVEAAACGLVALYALVTISFNTYYSKFETSKWVHYPRKRVLMVDNLLAEHRLTGLTGEEVTNLLGEPTEPAYFKDDNNIVYYLGPERGLISIDSEWLVILLDENNKVTGVEIKRD